MYSGSHEPNEVHSSAPSLFTKIIKNSYKKTLMAKWNYFIYYSTHTHMKYNKSPLLSLSTSTTTLSFLTILSHANDWGFDEAYTPSVVSCYKHLGSSQGTIHITPTHNHRSQVPSHCQHHRRGNPISIHVIPLNSISFLILVNTQKCNFSKASEDGKRIEKLVKAWCESTSTQLTTRKKNPDRIMYI